MNRLRWHLVDAVPRARGLAQAQARSTDARVLDRVDRRLREAARRRARAGSRASRSRSSARLNRQIDAARSASWLELDHRAPPQRCSPSKAAGALTAAILIGHTAGAERFRTDASFALQTGHRADPVLLRRNAPNTGSTAAATASSTTRCTSSRSPAPSTTPPPSEYLARKEAEGKTNKGALRCLKRHLARRFHQLLAEPPADQQQATNGQPTVEPHAGGQRRQAAGDPAASAPPARSPADRCSPRPDGLHQHRANRPPTLRAVLRPSAAAANARRRHRLPQIAPDRSPISPSPTPSRPRSQPVCGPRQTIRDRQHPRSDATPAPKPANPAISASAQKRANSDRPLT